MHLRDVAMYSIPELFPLQGNKIMHNLGTHQRADTIWFRDAKWGIFVHYLYDMFLPDVNFSDAVSAWNQLIDDFDVEGLARQLAEIKAGYFMITIGQNSGFYLSPNATYDSLVKHEQSRCTQRDLVADLVEALAPYKIPMMVYLPSFAPCMDRIALESLKCTPDWNDEDLRANGFKPGGYTVLPDIDSRLTEFQYNWEAIIREWSLRWGENIHGWWFDGVYRADVLYRHHDPPNFASFAAAAKAGNPNSLVAFNPGGLVAICQSESEDYTAGEICCGLHVPNEYERTFNPNGMLDGDRLHFMTYMGTNWGRASLRFPTELIVGYTKLVNQWNAVITWEFRTTPEGRIPDEFMTPLCALRDATR
jgi:hypothetical protein